MSQLDCKNQTEERESVAVSTQAEIKNLGVTCSLSGSGQYIGSLVASESKVFTCLHVPPLSKLPTKLCSGLHADIMLRKYIFAHAFDMT